MTDISVVIPTFNRAATLDRCLEHLAAQSVGPHRFEVIVADDGSTDETPQVARSWARSSRLPVTYLQCQKGFAGAARNRGAEVAGGDRILFVGDDVMAATDLVERHLRAEQTYGRDAAFVGSVSLDRDGYTPFMDFLETTGVHHAFPQLGQRIGQPLEGWYLYACNASVPRTRHLAVGGFDETVLRAYEDGEYGTRLVAGGCPLYFVPDAHGTHVHPTTPSTYLRFLRAGRADVARVTRMAVERGEPAPRLDARPVLDRVPLDRAVEVGADLLSAVDRWLPPPLRWRLYRSLLRYERRQAYLMAALAA